MASTAAPNLLLLPPILASFNLTSLPLPTTLTTNCGHVANLLAPLSDAEINASNPAMIDIGLLAILGLFNHTQLPPPLDTATASDLVLWWQISLATDRAAATAFFKRVATLCMQRACSSTTGIGEADIAGIGVTVANAMLAILVVAFWFFALVHSPGPAHQGLWHHDCLTPPPPTARKRRLVAAKICGALRATIDDVFDGALVFSISLHVATLSYQSGYGMDSSSSDGSGSGTTTRYEVTFAQTSCTFAALSVMTLWHIRHELARPRLHTRLFFYAMCALSLAVFVMRALYWLYPTTFWDESCVKPSSSSWWHNGRALFDLLSAVYFGLALLATFLPMDVISSRLFPHRVGRKGEYATRGLVSKLRFTQSFFGAGGIFVYMIVMNQGRSNFEDENTWSIGQYLAVATWVPSIAKMIYFLFSGIEKSLADYLPLPWVAALPPLVVPEDAGGEAEAEESVNSQVAEEGRRIESGEDDDDVDGQEEGVLTRRNTDLSTFSSSSTGSSSSSGERVPGGPLIRRDSDMTVIGDAPEPVKLKEPKLEV